MRGFNAKARAIQLDGKTVQLKSCKKCGVKVFHAKTKAGEQLAINRGKTHGGCIQIAAGVAERIMRKYEKRPKLFHVEHAVTCRAS